VANAPGPDGVGKTKSGARDKKKGVFWAFRFPGEKRGVSEFLARARRFSIIRGNCGFWPIAAFFWSFH